MSTEVYTLKEDIKHFKKSNKGFTLVELVVSVAILVLVSLPFAVAFITATRINGTARNKERANTVATSEMEYLRSSDISTLFPKADRQGSSGVVIPFTRTNSVSSIHYDAQGTLVSHDQKYTTSGAADKMNSYTYTNTVTVDKKPFRVEAEITPFADSSIPLEDQTAYYNRSGVAHFPVITTNVGTNVEDANFNISDSTNELMASKLADYYFPEDSEYGVASGATGSYVIRKNSNTDSVLKNMYRDVTITVKNTKLSNGSGSLVGVGNTAPANGEKILTEVYAKATFRYQRTKTYEVELPTQCIYSNVYTYDDSTTTSDKYSNLETVSYSFSGNEKSVSGHVLDSIHIINNSNIKFKFYIDEKNAKLANSNKYYINVFTTKGVYWNGLTPMSYQGSSNILTTVTAGTQVNPVFYYSDSETNYKQRVIRPEGLYEAKYLVNYTTDIGTKPTATSNTPIYVITMKVYSGDETHRARKELIELKSTLQ